MKIWVCGANGLLGSALCDVVKPDVTSGKEQADVRNLDSLMTFTERHPGITHIINAGAFTEVELAQTQSEEAWQVNALGPENLGRVGKKIGARVIHISTDYVFGNGDQPFKEEDLTRPLNDYGKTKLEGEKRLFEVFPQACVIRSSWLFGKKSKNFFAKLFSWLLTKEEVCLADDEWGRPTYAKDLAKAIDQMLDKEGLYHYANRGMASRFLVGVTMKEILEKKGFPILTKQLKAVSQKMFPSSCTRPAYSVLNTSKIENIVSIRPWQEAMDEFYDQV